MGKAVLILDSRPARMKAAAWIAKAKDGTRVEFRGPRRTLPQNDRMWAMLTELAEQVTWHGQRLSAGDWKDVFTAGLRKEVRLVPNLDGDGFVMLGDRTSEMGVEEMSQLIELMHARAEQLGVKFTDGRSTEVPNTASATAA